MLSTQMHPHSNAGRRIFVALDVDSEAKAIEIARECAPFGVGFKVGLQLFTLGGSALVSKVVGFGNPVFLDLKFHDIPNTVAAAVAEVVGLGVSILNVHALGGREMMRRAADSIKETAAKSEIEPPQLIAVTVLTSSDGATLTEIGVGPNVDEQVARLARLAFDSGMDGVVASARETKLIRTAVNEPNFLIVTPGIRPRSATTDDQRRVTTPGEAILSGASHVVIGRPVIAAADRAGALEEILHEIDAALQ